MPEPQPMAEQPFTAPPKDETNPFAPPQADPDNYWCIADPQAEALIAPTSRKNLM